MPRRSSFTLALAACALGGGCGTVLNLEDEHRVYGGVRTEAVAGSACLVRGLGLTQPEGHDKFSRDTSLMLGACALLDLPLSAVGDTLTLPLTIPATISKGANERESGVKAWEQN